MIQSVRLHDNLLPAELLQNYSVLSLATNATSVDFLNKTNRVNILETKIYQNFRYYTRTLYLTLLFNLLCCYEFTKVDPDQLRFALRIASSALMMIACASGAYAKLKFKSRMQICVVFALGLAVLTTIAYIYIFVRDGGISEIRQETTFQSIIGVIYMIMQLVFGLYLFPDAIRLNKLLKKRTHIVEDLNVRRTESWSRSASTLVLNVE